MDLFEYNYMQREKQNAPLASRMRPVTLEEFVGQEHIIAKDKLLYRAIQCDRLSSILLYGPPGTGKTTLAKIIANTTKNNFQQLNATTSGIKDIKETIEKAKITLGMYQNKTILFIDEIHRFNKTQQDALLPYVEDGTIILIGATTENPYFEVNKALVSRSVLFELKPLTSTNIKQILQKALENTEKGLGNYHAQISQDAIDFLADVSNGDARTALNALELAVLTTQKDETGTLKIDLTIAQDCIQKRALNYDKNGDNHYDTISAFIKSIRGSDPHAALYYLAKMLYAGEDPKFIARRIIIAASEDIGNADPHALQVAVSAAQAVHFIGMPECRIILAQAVTYLSCAPKSNACYMGIEKAMQDVINVQIKSIPSYLKDCHYSGIKKKEKLSYQYPHDFLGNYVKQQYLPDELMDRIYYEPTENGVEKRIKEVLKRLGKGSVVNGTNSSK